MSLRKTAAAFGLLVWATLAVSVEPGKADKAAGTDPVVVNFEEEAPGQPPSGFSTALTGKGPAGVWVIEATDGAPSGKKVLAQTSDDPTGSRYPLCLYDGVTAKDVDVAVRFRPMEGKKDQAAGIVFRCKDKDNYYVARANAREDNVRVYRIENGKRSNLANADVKVASKRWQTLRLVIIGNQIEVRLDDKVVLELEDGTFGEAGKVGVWTKADSQTQFDDLTIKSLD